VVVIRGIRSKSRVSGPTHRDSSVLDLVAACDAVPVSVVCVDRSDHSLLHWPVTSDRPTIPSVLSAPVRGWTWTCFVRDLPRQIFVCRHLGRPTSMRPRHYTTTSSHEFLTKFFRLALLFGDHDRLTHGFTPTAGPPIASPAVWSVHLGQPPGVLRMVGWSSCRGVGVCCCRDSQRPLPFGRICFVVLVMRKGGESS